MAVKLPYQLAGISRVIALAAYGVIALSLLIIADLALGFLGISLLDAQALWVAVMAAAGLMVAMQLLMIFWMYRAAANGRMLMPDDRWIRPIWQVIWWVVPVFWFWQPYRGMSQIWNGSIDDGYDLNGPAAPAVTLWWFFFLIGTALAGYTASAGAGSIYMDAMMLVFFVGSAGAALTILRSVGVGQAAKAAGAPPDDPSPSINDVSIAKAAP